MRILWNNDRFEAELTPGDLWRNDKDSIQAVGFRTEGPPSWTWFTNKAANLNKLRENKPQSGLVLTQLALQKYQEINKQEEEKAALKKQFDLCKKEAGKVAKKELAKKDDYEYYADDTGITCIVVKAAEPIQMMHKFVRPSDLANARCLICDDPLYFYEAKNICLFCEIKS
jgi:hypothetical protein